MKTVCIVFSLALLGCASSTAKPTPQAPSSTHQPTASEQVASPEPASEDRTVSAGSEADAPQVSLTRDVPRQCADEDCLPPPEFAQSLCKGKYPGLAILMFEKSSPWTRKWVNMKSLEAVNAFGGSTSGGDLVFAEEVLLLRRQSAASGGIQVSGGEDVDVLRWNGTCVTVRESELVEYVPGLPQQARIVWNYLDEGIQQALLGNRTIEAARKRHRKECRGSSKKSLTGPCKKADEALTAAVVVAVRKGIELPVPQKRPEWADASNGESLAQASRD